MNISEAKELKHELEADIERLISNFETDTKLEVTSIDMNRIPKMSGGSELMNVQTDIYL